MIRRDHAAATKRPLLCALGAAALAGAIWVPATARGELDAARLEAELRREMQATSTPGASLAIVRDGRVEMSLGLGVASVETGQPVTPDTLFRIGSTSKMFTGLAAGTLAAEGRLDLHAPISRYAPDLDAAVGALTMHQLLTHTAGVINEGSADGSHDDSALETRVKGWRAQQLFAPADDVYSYSSPGYWLAGYVLERITGQPFADAIRARVLEPLGMTRSTFRPFLALTYPLALDHRIANGAATVARPFPDDASTWPGGSLFSSARELASFATALLSDGRAQGKPGIPPGAVRPLLTRQTPTSPGCGYTYGLSECGTGAAKTLTHYGFRSGSGSVVTLIPAQRAAIVILANRAGGILARTEAAAKRMLIGEQPPPEKAAQKEMPRETFTALAGRYVHGRDVITLGAAADGLRFRFNDLAAQPVRALNDVEIAVLNEKGTPVQLFRLVKGRKTGDTYLWDGLSAFRRQ